MQNSHDAVRTFSEAVVIGRLGSKVIQRELPSGDVITAFTVIVDRPVRERTTTKVDAIACQTLLSSVVNRLDRLDAGDMVRVEGTLRRRFWRAGAGLGSAMEVDVRRLVRVRVRP